MYICPNCKSGLREYSCTECGLIFQCRDDGIPTFFTNSKISKTYEEIGSFYDNFYEKTEDSWNQLASRGPEFIKFIASIVAKTKAIRFLDIGCGEGFILEGVTANEKFGLDVSHKALQATNSRSDAKLCIGFSEELPYPTSYFDTITSIGVMTHFVDDLKATKEINRILKPGGIYIVGIYLQPSVLEKILSKVSQFYYSKPKFSEIVKWVFNKIMKTFNSNAQRSGLRKDHQPVEIHYTHNEVVNIFNESGFTINDLITKRKNPDAPLAGYHFRIYVLQK